VLGNSSKEVKVKYVELEGGALTHVDLFNQWVNQDSHWDGDNSLKQVLKAVHQMLPRKLT